MDVVTAQRNIMRTFILGEAEWILHSGGCWCCQGVELHAYGRGAGLIPGPSPAWLSCDQNVQPLMAVLWYKWNEWLHFLGSSPTNHKNITCGRQSRGKSKDKMPIGTEFSSCKRQDEIFQTYTNQMLEYLEASLEDRTEAALRRSYPWTNTNWNLFFWVAHLASFINTEFTLAYSRQQAC